MKTAPAQSNYASNRTWSDRFIPQIKHLVGPHLLCVSDEFVDMTQAADLVVLHGRNVTIACRMRRHVYWQEPSYRGEFTIRSSLDTKTKTELPKIVDGWADWFFYGFADETEQYVLAWRLLDLNVFRACLIRRKMAGCKLELRQEIPNGDGTRFQAFQVKDFPRCIQIASSFNQESFSDDDPF